MTPGREETTAARFAVHEGPPPVLGETLFEREIPSDPALIIPLVIRSLECMKSAGLLVAADEQKVGLCFEEALQNAVKHGNKKDFEKKVRFVVFRGAAEWGIVVSDEGEGFDPSQVRDPVGADGLWGESGRGLYLILHYMDRAELYDRGSTVVMARKL